MYRIELKTKKDYWIPFPGHRFLTFQEARDIICKLREQTDYHNVRITPECQIL